MKHQTRAGLYVLLVAAVAVAGWLILTNARPAGQPLSQPVADSAGSVPQALNISAPPQETLAKEAALTEVAVVDPVPPVEKAVAQASPSAVAATESASAPAVTEAKAAAGSAASSAPISPTAEARSLIAAGKKSEARALLTPLVLAAPDGPERDEMRALLDALSQELFFSRAPSPDAEFYTIQRGDALANIARDHGKDIYFADLIMKINGLKDPRKIQVGQKLKIPTGTFSAIVQKKSHRLIVFLNGAYVKEYPVALGALTSPTPALTFKVANNKTVNPDWKGHKFGDPENILGTRWIGFENMEQYSGYGIHGTSMPDTVGKDASEGCIRMLNSDVEEVFTMLMPGNTVEVVP